MNERRNKNISNSGCILPKNIQYCSILKLNIMPTIIKQYPNNIHGHYWSKIEREYKANISKILSILTKYCQCWPVMPNLNQDVLIENWQQILSQCWLRIDHRFSAKVEPILSNIGEVFEILPMFKFNIDWEFIEVGNWANAQTTLIFRKVSIWYILIFIYFITYQF